MHLAPCSNGKDIKKTKGACVESYIVVHKHDVSFKHLQQTMHLLTNKSTHAFGLYHILVSYLTDLHVEA